MRKVDNSVWLCKCPFTLDENSQILESLI